ncbi:MAG: diacylglycerol kinase family protein [bacterium]|nr:diacylglycerol kinase family protein [bacterium]
MEPSRRVSLVWNGRAGTHTRRAGLAKVIGAILARPPNPQRVYGPQTLHELELAAQHIHRDRPDILGIAGGDGTVHRTLTAVMRSRDATHDALPDILIVPVGTMNNVAAALGITRMPPVEFTRRIVEKITLGIPLDYVHVRPLMVGDACGFLYGAAAPVNLLQRYYAKPETVGLRRGIEVIAETLWDELLGLLPFRNPQHLLTSPVTATFVLPGYGPPIVASRSYTGLMVGAIDQVGSGCRALPRALEQPGRFMVRATRLSFWGLIGNLIRIWTGQPIPQTFDAVVSHAVIEYAAPTVTMIDGELRPPTTRDVITCGPLLRFIIG